MITIGLSLYVWPVGVVESSPGGIPSACEQLVRTISRSYPNDEHSRDDGVDIQRLRGLTTVTDERANTRLRTRTSGTPPSSPVPAPQANATAPQAPTTTTPQVPTQVTTPTQPTPTAQSIAPNPADVPAQPAQATGTSIAQGEVIDYEDHYAMDNVHQGVQMDS
ncbi:hypothetical protein FRC11_002781 [Ceratobasidium sp. 423]|nr:hypothetical protein FRC11_002781 [Ceratobasidium sp. 423]